ncbi:MAG: class I SAM-dependent methyltransferase [Nanoarchaeota archaeon]|nr:class I SAM-dependent methyltransferase [Nanoarchaeota archaeon]
MVNAKTVQKRYDRFSIIYDLFEYPIEKLFFSKWREKYIGQVKGNVLEIGVGTGKNLPYYKKDTQIIGIDISSKMLAKAHLKVKELNKNINLKQADATKLPFKDKSFDYVVCTFVLCSVPDPVATIKEMVRVCKEGGKVVMLEHTISKSLWMNFLLKIHDPITQAIFGFSMKRDTIRNIEIAGFESKVKGLGLKDVFKRIIIEV